MECDKTPKILKTINKNLLALERDVHYAVLGQSTCLRNYLDNYKVPAYCFQQKAPPHCPSSFFSAAALEGVLRVVPFEFFQSLKYLTNILNYDFHTGEKSLRRRRAIIQNSNMRTKVLTGSFKKEPKKTWEWNKSLSVCKPHSCFFISSGSKPFYSDRR